MGCYARRTQRFTSAAALVLLLSGAATRASAVSVTALAGAPGPSIADPDDYVTAQLSASLSDLPPVQQEMMPGDPTWG